MAPALARHLPGVEKKEKQKRRARPPAAVNIEQDHVEHILPQQLQQSILDVFTQAFPVISQHDDFKRTMQEVKGHLYNRDFQAAFGRQEYLDVYASRWSAARALAYTNIFTDPHRTTWFVLPSTTDEKASTHDQDDVVQPLTGRVAAIDVGTQNAALINGETSKAVQSISERKSNSKPATHMKVVCIGGGAGAELVALAATSRYIRSEYDDASSYMGQVVFPPRYSILALDVADWSESVRKLSSAFTSVPALPTSASQAVQNANRALVDPASDGQIHVEFRQQDILEASPNELRELLQHTSLITIMFTLNELFSTSLPKTTAFLLHLTELISTDAHLVVVDSPGSYSEIKLGNKPASSETSGPVKKYPMKWLLDHTLLDVAGKGSNARWVKLEDEESKWFRINEKLGLRYAVDLENCRYQIHVYKKIK